LNIVSNDPGNRDFSYLDACSRGECLPGQSGDTVGRVTRARAALRPTVREMFVIIVNGLRRRGEFLTAGKMVVVVGIGRSPRGSHTIAANIRVLTLTKVGITGLISILSLDRIVNDYLCPHCNNGINLKYLR